MEHLHLSFYKVRSRGNLWPFFYTFSGHTPGNKNGAYRPDTPIYLQKKLKNCARYRRRRMDTTFVNKIIVAFNELISELGEDSVGVCGLKNDGRMTILLGVTSPSQLAASVIMNGGTIFSLSDTNPRAIAERMDKALDEFNAIAQKLDDENVTFDDNFDFKISAAFHHAMHDIANSER